MIYAVAVMLGLQLLVLVVVAYLAFDARWRLVELERDGSSATAPAKPSPEGVNAVLQLLSEATALRGALRADAEVRRKTIAEYARQAERRAGHVEQAASEARALVAECDRLARALREGLAHAPPPAIAAGDEDDATRVLNPAPSESAPRARTGTLVSASEVTQSKSG